MNRGQRQAGRSSRLARQRPLPPCYVKSWPVCDMPACPLHVATGRLIDADPALFAKAMLSFRT